MVCPGTRMAAIANSSCEHNGEKVVWKDLAQFDHQHTRDPEDCIAIASAVVEHLLALGFEGLRCDAAYQVPRNFWHRLIRDIKSQHPHTCFVAETLGCSADQTRTQPVPASITFFNSSKWWDFRDWWLIRAIQPRPRDHPLNQLPGKP